MTGRTHDLAAITLLGAVLAVHPIGSVSLATGLIAVLANQIGGIAPDIDQPTAPFWRNLPAEGVIGRFVDKLLGGHRFLTHSLLGGGLLAVGAYYLLVFLHPLMPRVDNTLVWYAFLIGLISHLLMDTLTKEGVPWLLPVPIKFGLPPLKALRVTTGHFVENLIIFPALILVDIWLVSRHYHAIVAFIHSRVGQ